MSWDQYRSKYHQFLISIHESELSAIVAGGALESFPKNLPASLKKGLATAMVAVAQALSKSLDAMRTGGPAPTEIAAKVPTPFSPAFMPMLHLSGLLLREGQAFDTFNFRSALFRQLLVMVIAHLEAFIGDSIRAICAAEPRVIESAQKQISWSDALAYADRAALLAGLVDSFVGSLTETKEIKPILEQLRKKANLEVELELDSQRAVALAQQVRHIVVHNGGRVDMRFRQKTNATTPIGNMFEVDEEFLKSAIRASLQTADAIFAAISKKFHSIPNPLEEVHRIRTHGVSHGA